MHKVKNCKFDKRNQLFKSAEEFGYKDMQELTDAYKILNDTTTEDD